MNSNQYANKDNRVRFLIMLISVATVLLVVCLLILVIHNVSGSGTKSNGTDNQDEKNFKINYTTITKATSDVKTGNLVLVNGSHAFTFPEKEEGLISMYTYRQNNPVPKLNGSGSVYQLADTSIRLREPAASQIHNMLVKFYEHSGNTNVNITSAYRTYDEQKNLASSIAAGYSDSHTGLACALRTYDGQKAGELKGDLATYGWIFDHCYEFGFIVRYPDGHDAHTGISNYTSTSVMSATRMHGIWRTARQDRIPHKPKHRPPHRQQRPVRRRPLHRSPSAAAKPQFIVWRIT